MAKNPANIALYPPTPARNLCGGYCTLADAREMGYTESGEIRRQAGYVSRRGDIEKSIVYIAGRGKKQGQFYYLAPCFDSTRYCLRVYLAKNGGAAT